MILFIEIFFTLCVIFIIAICSFIKGYNYRKEPYNIVTYRFKGKNMTNKEIISFLVKEDDYLFELYKLAKRMLKNGKQNNK